MHAEAQIVVLIITVLVMVMFLLPPHISQTKFENKINKTRQDAKS